MNRVPAIDYLRGLMALSVMVYHYTGYATGRIGAESLLGKLGIYAVEVFYVLSGLSLTIVYTNRLSTNINLCQFAIKRAFRIAPLFWIVVTLAIISSATRCWIESTEYSFPLAAALLNYSLLFGFIKPTAYLSTGAWSIGNEIVFYFILPLVILGYHKRSLYLIMAILTSLFISIAFSFFILDASIPLEDQWAEYINPINQMFLFIAGIGIGMYGARIAQVLSRSMMWLILAAASAVFYFAPTSGNEIVLVAGSYRILFLSSVIIFVLIVYVLKPRVQNYAGKILGFLGEGSYSIYLLHPIVASPIVFIFIRLGSERWIGYLVSALVTIAASRITYSWVEKPMMRLGSKMAERLGGRELLSQMSSSGVDNGDMNSQDHKG